MANWSQNISNTVNCFGPGPSTKFGDANGYPYTGIFGTSKWGEGESLPIAFIKVISNSETIDTTIIKHVRHLISETVTPVGDLSSEQLTDGTGLYEYVFVSNTNEGEERDFASWSESSNDSVSFSCQAAGSTTWTEV